MSIKAMIAAAAAGGAAWVIFKSAKVAGSEAKVIYVSQPAKKSTADKLNNALGIFDQVAGIVDGLTGKPIFGGSTGGGDALPSMNFAGGDISANLTNWRDLVSGIGGGGGGGGYKPLLDLIGRAEAPGGYDTVYNGSKVRPNRPITQMTVSEVLDWQSQSVSAGSVSSAAGRYQIIKKTMESLVRDGTLNAGERFSPAAQDRAAVALMRRRGLSSYEAGKSSPETFANSLAKEWAGLPVVTGSKAGKSYYAGYAGNNSTVTPSAVLAAIRSI